MLSCITENLWMIPCSKILTRFLQESWRSLPKILQDIATLARSCQEFWKILAKIFLWQLEDLFKRLNCSIDLVPHCTGQNMYNVLKKSCMICARFLQEIPKESPKNLGKNLAKFLPRPCKILKILKDLVRLCNSCKIFTRNLARFLSRVYRLKWLFSNNF
jgi:hypothetical protein